MLSEDSSDLSLITRGAGSYEFLWINFIVFSVLFSITHATVDAILSFSSSELGPSIASVSAFLLYGLYTTTSLLFTKLFLSYFSTKFGVLIGLVGMLIYVFSFLFSLLYPTVAFPVFTMGSVCGGIGAGILWPSQGCYYRTNAIQYARLNGKDEAVTKVQFSSIFAGLYLSIEGSITFAATLVYIIENSRQQNDWRLIVFTLYAAAALLSVLLFQVLVYDIDYGKLYKLSMRASFVSHSAQCCRYFFGSSRRSYYAHTATGDYWDAESKAEHSTSGNDNNDRNKLSDIDHSESNQHSTRHTLNDLSRSMDSERQWTAADLRQELTAVTMMMVHNRKLQLLLPYQVCFGLSTGFVNFYVNSELVAAFIGDGNIGVLTTIGILSASLLTYPFSIIANKYADGKCYIMIAGGFCFLYTAITVLLLPISAMGNWPFLCTYFLVHGTGRGVWESTNKAVIVDYFPHAKQCECAFAAVCFAYGLSGALGFLCYQFMNRFEIALLNTLAAAAAIVGFYYSGRVSGQDEFTRVAAGRGEGRDESWTKDNQTLHLTADTVLESS